MEKNIHAIPVRRIDGTDSTLETYRGSVLLIVNVASRCGLTSQYAGLVQLHERYRERGFAVLGFPANDFAGQEPGSDSEIQAFCTATYGVEFPLYSKLVVTGPDKHPLYAWLTQALPEAEGRAAMEAGLKEHGIDPQPSPEVLWNFEKFLIGRDGRVLRRFAPDTLPDDSKLVGAVEAALLEGR
ncbi:glutathione peroxidase [Pseudothauera nasutitermitis]|uniref:Glutathione peroxidase n=1 Tax=Pseudothauera nasutitermitis TaxID=2565930 RepID=A0A4S4AWJ9_9RHOO|nr:glutathione peroxidase [Pseudothauera nasutitermitis]THF63635.1 glutathione peroxidase [Pseudothauera nasutitermitis]